MLRMLIMMMIIVMMNKMMILSSDAIGESFVAKVDGDLHCGR